MGVISVESKEKAVKVCPIVSNTEIAIVHSPIDSKQKAVPKFVPMGCLGKSCMFYNEEVKQCIFVMQMAMISSIAGKILDVEKKGE